MLNKLLHRVKICSPEMMTRKILLALIIIYIFTNMSLFAVDFSYGVKGGVNLAKFVGDDAEKSGLYDSKSKIGFSAGLFVSISPIDMIAIQPAILFSLKGTKVELEGFEGYEYDNLYYIEIPLLESTMLSYRKLYTFRKMIGQMNNGK